VHSSVQYSNTGIRGLMRGMATLPQGIRELLVVRQKLEDPQVSLGLQACPQNVLFSLQCLVGHTFHSQTRNDLPAKKTGSFFKSPLAQWLSIVPLCLGTMLNHWVGQISFLCHGFVSISFCLEMCIANSFEVHNNLRGFRGLRPLWGCALG